MKQAESEPQIGSQQSSQDSPAGFKLDELELSIEQMLKFGVHFGHKKSSWNPKMKPYVFSVRSNINIIDLEKTLALLQKAVDFAKNIVQNGGKILFVGTKPQARKLVEEMANLAGMPYVSNRWLGGTFTNFSEIKKRIKYLNEQEEKLSKGELGKYTKYEQLMLKKEIERMNEKIGGIKKMETLPQAVFVTDAKENLQAIKEAKRMKISVIAILDTNVDPDEIDYPIPGNDDALSSLKYLVGIVAKNIESAKAQIKNKTVAKENELKK